MKRKNKIKKTNIGRDLVAQRSRYHHFEVLFRDLQDGHDFRGEKMNRKNDKKTMVGFRTEVSIR